MRESPEKILKRNNNKEVFTFQIFRRHYKITLIRSQWYECHEETDFGTEYNV